VEDTQGRDVLMALYNGIELCGAPDLDNVRKLDLLPVRSVMEMQRYGMAIDIEHLQRLTETLTKEIQELRIEICSEIPAEKLDEFVARANVDDDDEYLPMNVESTQQMRKLLFEVLGVGRGKELKRTKSGDISTGKRQMEARKSDHPIVQKVLDYRERAKLKGTYSAKLPKIARFHPRLRCWCGLPHFEATYRVHCDVLLTRTATGRPATKNPNLQNIPVRSEHGRDVRRAFIASPGTEMVTVDFSQLELRLLAHFARAERLIKWFQEGKDPHTQTAMAAFGLSDEAHVDKLTQRAPAKNVNFAIVYGETAQGLYEQLVSDTYGKSGIVVPEWLTLEWCEKFIADWLQLHPEVQEYMRHEHYCARRYGVVWTSMGRIRRVPEVRSVHKRVVAAGERQAGNHKIQGTGADMLKLAQAEIQDFIEQELRPEGIWCRPLNEVHDELIYEVEQGYGEILLAKCEDVMSNVLVDKESGESLCRVPIVAEGKVMARWEK
jgi:DNA polymerase I